LPLLLTFDCMTRVIGCGDYLRKFYLNMLGEALSCYCCWIDLCHKHFCQLALPSRQQITSIDY